VNLSNVIPETRRA